MGLHEKCRFSQIPFGNLSIPKVGVSFLRIVPRSPRLFPNLIIHLFNLIYHSQTETPTQSYFILCLVIRAFTVFLKRTMDDQATPFCSRFGRYNPLAQQLFLVKSSQSCLLNLMLTFCYANGLTLSFRQSDIVFFRQTVFDKAALPVEIRR